MPIKASHIFAFWLTICLVLGCCIPASFADSSRFHFALLRYEGGNWNARPGAWKTLISFLNSATNVDGSLADKNLRVKDPHLFDYPFLFMMGSIAFPPFPEEDVARLRRYLSLGGLLVIDNSAGLPAGEGFDKSVHRLAGRLFPRHKLAALDSSHTVYKTFYLLKGTTGRIESNPLLLGVQLADATPLIYSANDLAGAWSQSRDGSWDYPLQPGHKKQRTLAFRVGVNLALFALTMDYKEDQVHTPFILKRRK